MCPNHTIPGSSMRRNAGLTAFEAAVFAFVVVVTIALLLRSDPGRRCRSKQSASQATVQDFCIALKSYEADFGDFPPDEPGHFITTGGRGSLADLMSRRGPKGIPYYEFRKDQFNAKGQWVTHFETPFKYRKNAGRPPVTSPDPSTMMNIHSFDIWASGCGDAPACDPETSEPATKATIKNW